MARNSRKAAPAARRAAPRVAHKAARTAAPKPLIAVDIGNSETTVGRFLGPELESLWRLSTNRATADELKLVLEGLLKTSASGWGAAMCTVVPALTRQWTEALRATTGRAPLSVSAATVPVAVRVPDPASVGADRLANAHAARRLYGAPAIVVDLGTATNFDCVAPDGAYVGGAIAPGMITASEDLFRRAARLARVDLRRPKHAIGRTTEECLRVGVLWGNAGMVDAIVRRLRAELGGRPKVIATGGLAHVLAPECETVDLVDEGLTLKGMRLLWEETS
jgi:type III pantothenate kinase